MAPLPSDQHGSVSVATEAAEVGPAHIDPPAGPTSPNKSSLHKPIELRRTALSLPTTSTQEQVAPEPLHRVVSFKDVEIRRHGICVGDNPCTLHGPPVSLDWSYSDVDERYDLDEYEAKRGGAKHRKEEQMKMPKSVRVKKLYDGGVSFAEMRKAELNVMRSQQERVMTIESLKFWRLEELLELLARRIRRLFPGRSKKKEQEKLWDYAKQWAEAQMAKTKAICSDQTQASTSTLAPSAQEP